MGHTCACATPAMLSHELPCAAGTDFKSLHKAYSATLCDMLRPAGPSPGPHSKKRPVHCMYPVIETSCSLQAGTETLLLLANYAAVEAPPPKQEASRQVAKAQCTCTSQQQLEHTTLPLPLALMMLGPSLVLLVQLDHIAMLGPSTGHPASHCAQCSRSCAPGTTSTLPALTGQKQQGQREGRCAGPPCS